VRQARYHAERGAIIVSVDHLAHGQNFNGKRRGLWERLHTWALSVASTARR
jgi:hypothetical protein